MADKKLHQYPKNDSINMRKISPAVMGGMGKQTTYNGPHLKQGNGTAYSSTKPGSGFASIDPRDGHKQAQNMTPVMAPVAKKK